MVTVIHNTLPQPKPNEEERGAPGGLILPATPKSRSCAFQHLLNLSRKTKILHKSTTAKPIRAFVLDAYRCNKTLCRGKQFNSLNMG
jgi:hypothetical protein